MKALPQNNPTSITPMTGLHVTLRDGVRATVAGLRIADTYDGQMAGTLTTGTRYRLPRIAGKMADLAAGKASGYYYLEPELVSEASLRGLTQYRSRQLRRNAELGMCLKDLHLVATLHISDPDYCHIIDLHWFQTGGELSETPLAALLQEAAGRLSSVDLLPHCRHEDWLDMF
ncbi:MAG: hypothetical protein J5674_01485 [Candidatus Methanomethylophilaceae archaeon]|nr:hypothetical protein [Candidatus Methanomethylophilaceae archaeon]